MPGTLMFMHACLCARVLTGAHDAGTIQKQLACQELREGKKPWLAPALEWGCARLTNHATDTPNPQGKYRGRLSLPSSLERFCHPRVAQLLLPKQDHPQHGRKPHSPSVVWPTSSGVANRNSPPGGSDTRNRPCGVRRGQRRKVSPMLTQVSSWRMIGSAWETRAFLPASSLQMLLPAAGLFVLLPGAEKLRGTRPKLWMQIHLPRLLWPRWRQNVPGCSSVVDSQTCPAAAPPDGDLLARPPILQAGAFLLSLHPSPCFNGQSRSREGYTGVTPMLLSRQCKS